MGYALPSRDSYAQARRNYGVTQSANVTRQAEERARITGQLSEIVDPAINPMRVSTIRLDAYRKQWIVTVGCPMDIESSVDTTGSMGGEVDVEMEVMPDISEAVAAVLPGYDPQLCFGIFGDCDDPFTMCRPQFEMESGKIVRYLKEMAPQRQGQGNGGEDPQYAMFARAYLTNAYTNRIGLKGYHFITTDEPCHMSITKSQIRAIFGKNIFENELADFPSGKLSVHQVVQDLKAKTHQFVFVRHGLDRYYRDTYDFWRKLCGEQSVIAINSTRCLPQVMSAVIGLTEGTLDVTDLHDHLGIYASADLVSQLSSIDIGAQARLRHALPHPVPKKGDIFAKKGDLWPVERATDGVSGDVEAVKSTSRVDYL